MTDSRTEVLSLGDLYRRIDVLEGTVTFLQPEVIRLHDRDNELAELVQRLLTIVKDHSMQLNYLQRTNTRFGS